MFAGNVHRKGHHKDYGDVALENGEKVLSTDQPTADEIDQRLGLAPPATDRQTQLQVAAEFLGEIAAWFAGSNSLHSAGMRAFALALLLKPDMLPDQSATGMALHLGCTKQALSKYISQLVLMGEGCFHFAGVRGRAARERQSKISIAYHLRAGHAVGQEARERKSRIMGQQRWKEAKQKKSGPQIP